MNNDPFGGEDVHSIGGAKHRHFFASSQRLECNIENGKKDTNATFKAYSLCSACGTINRNEYCQHIQGVVPANYRCKTLSVYEVQVPHY